MASITYIEKRVEGKKKEIEKLTKKLERINKAAATNWEVNPYYYSESDLKWTTRDLDKANEDLAKYEEELRIATEKENSRNVKVIVEFLEKWQKHMNNWFHLMLSAYEEEYEEYCKKDRAICDAWNNGLRWKDKESYDKMDKEWREYKREFKSKWNFLTPYIEWKNGGHILNETKLTYDLRNEANAKYDDIIERTNKITGTITDASELKIGAKGDLNGYIIGEKGIAKVNTIGAGGYNIQCYHFRTLIHKK